MIDGAEEIADARRPPVQARRRRAARRRSQPGLEFEGIAARRGGAAAAAASMQFLEGDGLLYVLNGLGPGGAVAGGKPTRGARAAADARGARARAVLVPLPRGRDDGRGAAAAAAPRTSEASTARRPSPSRARRLLPAGRPAAAAPGAARAARCRRDAAPEDDRRSREDARDRLAGAAQPVPRPVQPLEDDQSYLVLTEPDKVE